MSELFDDPSEVTNEWLNSLGGSRGADMVVDDAVGRQAWHDPDAWTFYGPSVVLWVTNAAGFGCVFKERSGDIDMEIRSKGHARLAFKLLEVDIDEAISPA